MKKDAVNILGAGLCGSLLSVMLARRGHAVTLWERQADPRTTKTPAGRSINLALAARGIRALQHAGVYDAVEPLLVPMRGRMLHHPDGSTEMQAYGAHDHEQIYSVSRADLNHLLLDRAETEHEVQIRFGRTAESFATQNQTLVMRDEASGRTDELQTAPLIAADGAGSVVRRAYATDSVIAPREELLGHGYKELNLPAAANGGFQIAPNALHIWPRGGFMLIALPNPDGDFTLTLFLSKDGETSFASLDTPTAVENFFSREFADILPLLPDFQTEFASNPVGILGTVRCQHWHDRNLLLIGDAAHAIVPFHGQGMNLAFEDCVLLDAALERNGNDWHGAFSTFEQQQWANGNAIADMALDNYVEMRDRVRDPKFVLYKKLAFEFERRMPDRFIARYSMVMFHPEIPYAVAQQRGVQQQALLQRICDGATTLEEVDLDSAEELIRKELRPLNDVIEI